MGFPVIFIAIAVVAIFFTYIVVSSSRSTGARRTPNYKALFLIGVTWLPIGLATENTALWSMGFIFLLLGLINKNKWGQETRWSDLSPEIKRLKLIGISGLVLILTGSIIYFLLASGGK
jgi:hypothetical protein